MFYIILIIILITFKGINTKQLELLITINSANIGNMAFNLFFINYGMGYLFTFILFSNEFIRYILLGKNRYPTVFEKNLETSNIDTNIIYNEKVNKIKVLFKLAFTIFWLIFLNYLNIFDQEIMILNFRISINNVFPIFTSN